MRNCRRWVASQLVRLSLALSSVAAIVPPNAPAPLVLLADAFVTLPCLVAATVGVDCPVRE